MAWDFDYSWILSVYRGGEVEYGIYNPSESIGFRAWSEMSVAYQQHLIQEACMQDALQYVQVSIDFDSGEIDA